jgi:uncharacterized lipoprotein YajG
MAELGCIFNYNKTNKMKKLFTIVAIATLTACGGASTEVKTDSTAVSTDTTVVKADSVTVK